MAEDKDKQQMDYLEKFLGDTPSTPLKPIQQSPKYGANVSDLSYLNVDLNQLPAGKFYKNGTLIKIRAAKVEEVQAYSVVDDSNYVDVTEKMNQMLSSCVRITFPNGMSGSYKDLRDADRLYLIFMIRELTFQKGNSLAKDVTCPFCSNEFKIQFRATTNQEVTKSFCNYEMNEKIKGFFNEDSRTFDFDINGVIYKLAPPTIGIQETFFGDISDKVQAKKKPNVSFLKIIPYTLWDRSTITNEGIKAKEDEFKRLDMDTFQILNKAVDLMVFGIKELTSKCPSCAQEVHSDMSFPDGASSIFVVSDPFNKFVGQ
jgi:hypothetical protein